MDPLWMVVATVLAAGPVRFDRHDIDAFPAGYQVAAADINADGRPDVIALSTTADRVDWYENPSWTRRPVVRTPKNIDLAPRDLDGDARPELALASGFYFSESTRGGQIQLLSQPNSLDGPWRRHTIAVDPVVHRLRWGDLDGDGRPELVHAPLFGPGSNGPRDPKPAHLWAFRPAGKPHEGGWQTWKIDQSLTVLHGLHVADLDGDGRDEILTASFEGICRFDFEGKGPASHRRGLEDEPPAGGWRKTQIAPGAKPISAKPGAPRGSSEVAPGRLADGRLWLAAIEPWHGHQVVVYLPTSGGGRWERRVVDRTLREGHALLVADLDGDGADEIVAGWRGAGGGLELYDPADADGRRYTRVDLDRGIAVEGAVTADLNRDGKLDLVVVGGRSNNLAWYENRTR